ncbi:MAG: hypothetical protein ACLUI3_14065 [Christensenellales bacterium]
MSALFLPARACAAVLMSGAVCADRRIRRVCARREGGHGDAFADGAVPVRRPHADGVLRETGLLGALTEALRPRWRRCACRRGGRRRSAAPSPVRRRWRRSAM